MVDVELPSLGGQHLIPRHKPSPNQTPTSVLRIRSLSPPIDPLLAAINHHYASPPLGLASAGAG